jgi:copper(I)-binding protein
MKALLFAGLLALWTTAATGHEIKFGDLEIVHPTVDEAKKGQVEAKGSMEIRNNGEAPDRLIAINAEFAEAARIESPDPTIPPNARILVPISFENIKRKLSEFEVYDGELIFAKAGRIKIEFMVHPHGHSSSPHILALMPFSISKE